MLSSSQVQHFKDYGFTVVPKLFNEREVAALQSELERFKQEGLGRNVSTDPDAKVNYQIIPVNDKSTLMRALPFAQKVITCVSTLIGDPFVRHLDQIFLKPPGLGSGTDWHQDNAYFKLEDPTKGTAMWIALHDANVANGTLHVIPNSHHNVYAHSRDPESDHHIHIEDMQDEEFACEVSAGGVVFFNYGIAHATKKNNTDRERGALAYHFFNSDYGDSVQLAGERVLVAITGPNATGGSMEYGETIAGTWDQEVASLA